MLLSSEPLRAHAVGNLGGPLAQKGLARRLADGDRLTIRPQVDRSGNGRDAALGEPRPWLHHRNTAEARLRPVVTTASPASDSDNIDRLVGGVIGVRFR